MCRDCVADFVPNTVCCSLCAMPLSVASSRCGACQDWPDDCTAVVAPWRYVFPLDRLIAALKYQRDLTVMPALTQLLPALPAALADAVLIAVPLHRQRMRERGFNQARLLASALSRRWRLQVCHTALQRTRVTPPQVTLHGSARRANVHNAFVANGCIDGASVCLVDDVLTSGATALAAAAALRQAGAREVFVFALARAGYAAGGRYK